MLLGKGKKRFALKPGDILIICVVLFYLLGLLILGREFVEAQTRNQILEEQIAKENAEVSNLGRRAAAVRQQMSEIEENLLLLRNDLPVDVVTVEVLSFLHQSSLETGVNISSVTWDPPRSAGRKDSGLSVGRLRLNAAGDVPGIAAFLRTLEQGRYKSLQVDEVRSGPAESAISLSLYAQP